MDIKLKNNASTLIVGSFGTGATTITVSDASVFPTITGSEYFYCTIETQASNEIVKVTAIAGNDLTIVRAQDDTIAISMNTDDKIQLRINKITLKEYVEQKINEGTIDIDDDSNGLYVDSESTLSSTYALNIETGQGGRNARFYESVNLYSLLVNEADNGVGSNWFYRNYDNTTTDSPVVFIEQDNASDDQDALAIQQDGTGNYLSAGNFVIDSSNNVAIGKTSANSVLDVVGDKAQLPAPNSEVVDGDLSNSQFSIWVDETDDTVNIKTKKSDGSIIKGSIQTPYIQIVDVGDDKGLNITQQLSVGSPENPKESVFGGGDSYGVGLEDSVPGGTPKVGSAWHCDVANTTGTTITSATDITTELASDVGSTVNMFESTATGKYILLGSDYKFAGGKIKFDTLATVEPANLTMEYLENSTTWTTALFMATGSDYPYTQLGCNVATDPSKSEQWRLGFDPLNLPVTWDKVTLNINGTDYTKYWGRVRINNTITGNPVLEQVKLHTNRMEINADGTSEYFGRARYKKTLMYGMNNTFQNTLKNPTDQNITYGSGTIADINNNSLADNTEDGFIIPLTIPEGLDTSIPLILTVTGYPTSALAGTVKFNAELFYISDGFVYDVANTPDLTVTGSDTFPIDSDNKRRTAQLLIPVNKLIPREEVIISFYRDGTHVDDTLLGSAVITNITIDGYFWRP